VYVCMYVCMFMYVCMYECYNFNSIVITLYIYIRIYGMKQICISILPFKFEKIYSKLYLPSTLVAP